MIILSYKSIKLAKTVCDELDKLRVHRPDIGENVYEKTYSVVVMDSIKNRYSEGCPVGSCVITEEEYADLTRSRLELEAINMDIVVVEWNERNPIGTEVTVTLDDGAVKQTKTRSEAWLASGTPVVMVEGISGGYMLSRVAVME
jgi:hypothetical protein